MSPAVTAVGSGNLCDEDDTGRGAVLENTVKRMERHLRRRGLFRIDEDGDDPDVPGDPESNLAASAVSGQTPPAGPQWLSGLAALERRRFIQIQPGRRKRPFSFLFATPRIS